MRYTRLAAVVLMMGFAAQNVSAQQPAGQSQATPVSATGEIRGTVLDKESNTPISSASVAVWDKATNKLVAGAIVKNDGTFRIEGLRPGTYNVKITMIGYSTETSESLVISDAAPRAVLGKVMLARAAVELAAVTATAEKAAIIAPDRNMYNAKAVAPGAANASEVLENVPSVAVDADGKVSLRGNENVVIQINGRPTPMTGAQLANYLKQLPANTLDRVEVMPNPSAKQDPEGMAG
ncbi:MAG TPA: carboxypeptidase regulatory-like domain-containing protein, partial [Longimicrobiales bacterium]|nr:carboxypeptidase regulatory-like domain-containing protein [Longimicrobiales bacterium]